MFPLAAKIGILGESTNGGTGTVTVYTVPADKAARVQIIFAAINDDSASEMGFAVGAPGSQLIGARTCPADVDYWTGVANGTTSKAAAIALIEGDFGGVLSYNADRGVLLPLPVDFYLSEGDTVKTVIATAAFAEILFQVIGVEDDA